MLLQIIRLANAGNFAGKPVVVICLTLKFNNLELGQTDRKYLMVLDKQCQTPYISYILSAKNAR